MFLTYLSCDPEYAAENLERIRQVYRQAADDGITQAELDQAKSKTSSQVVLASERPASRLFSVGLNWVQRHEYRSVRQVLDSYDAVTLGRPGHRAKKLPAHTIDDIRRRPVRGIVGLELNRARRIESL